MIASTSSYCNMPMTCDGFCSSCHDRIIRAQMAANSLSREVVNFERDVKRAAVRAESKGTFWTWAGTKNGRPFHLRKWYR